MKKQLARLKSLDSVGQLRDRASVEDKEVGNTEGAEQILDLTAPVGQPLLATINEPQIRSAEEAEEAELEDNVFGFGSGFDEA